jgi:hypothetical protein
MDMALAIAIVVLLVVIGWSLFKIPREGDLAGSDDGSAKLREGLVYDIRGANQYCMAYIALLGVIATIAAGHLTDIRPVLDKIPFWPFGVAFGAATVSVLFVPAGYGRGSFSVLKYVWLRTIICEQITVVTAGYGIWRLCTAMI